MVKAKYALQVDYENTFLIRDFNNTYGHGTCFKKFYFHVLT